MCFAVGERFGVGVSFSGVPVLFPFGEWGTVIGPFLGRFALQRFSSKVARRESSAVSSAVAAPERASPQPWLLAPPTMCGEPHGDSGSTALADSLDPLPQVDPHAGGTRSVGVHRLQTLLKRCHPIYPSSYARVPWVLVERGMAIVTAGRPGGSRRRPGSRRAPPGA